MFTEAPQYNLWNDSIFCNNILWVKENDSPKISKLVIRRQDLFEDFTESKNNDKYNYNRQLNCNRQWASRPYSHASHLAPDGSWTETFQQTRPLTSQGPIQRPTKDDLDQLNRPNQRITLTYNSEGRLIHKRTVEQRMHKIGLHAYSDDDWSSDDSDEQLQSPTQTRFLPRVVTPAHKNDLFGQTFFTNLLKKMQCFIKNDTLEAAVFDASFKAIELRVIQQKVKALNLGVNGLINDVKIPEQKTLLKSIIKENPFVLATMIRGDKLDELHIFKAAPSDMYLITPFDLRDEEDDENPNHTPLSQDTLTPPSQPSDQQIIQQSDTSTIFTQQSDTYTLFSQPSDTSNPFLQSSDTSTPFTQSSSDQVFITSFMCE